MIAIGYYYVFHYRPSVHFMDRDMKRTRTSPPRALRPAPCDRVAVLEGLGDASLNRLCPPGTMLLLLPEEVISGLERVKQLVKGVTRQLASS